MMVLEANAMPNMKARTSERAVSRAKSQQPGSDDGSKIMLLRSYGDAAARSREAGHVVSFRVEVDPTGHATILTVEDGNPGKIVEKPESELRRALEAARERGRLRAAEILGGEGMLSADDFARLIGTTRVTVNAKRRNGQILGLGGAKRGFRFPVWQLDPEGKPYAELAALRDRLGNPWALYRFLVQPHGALDGLTGREALEQGRSTAVLDAAEGIAEGEFR